MHRLSGFDTSLWILPSQPMTGFALWDLDTSTIPGGYSFEQFRAKLSERIPALPELRMKVIDSRLDLGFPVWVDDPEFDLDHHVHRVQLAAPGDRGELLRGLGQIIDAPMDLTRPLWDIWVIENLSADHPDFSGSVAVMHRFHHVLGDGVTALDILSRLCTTEADPPPPQPIAGVGTVSTRQMVLDGLVRFALRLWFLVGKVVPAAFAALVKTVRRAVRGQSMPGLFTAPRTPFNGRLTGRRTIAYVQLDLDDIRRVKKRFGVTVNDVLLALLSGALRQFLLDRAALPAAPLVAGITVSVYREDNPARNQDSFIFSHLHTEIADPTDRLKAIAASTSVAKQHHSAMRPTLFQDLMECSPRLLSWFEAVLRPYYSRYQRDGRRPVANLILSNVPGPQRQYYLTGAAVRARYAFGPLLYGAGLNLVAMSLNGKLDVGLVSCTDLMPDLWEVADGLPIALKDLLDAAA